ncbi:hypothetical protein [Victivallis sp. Marseille-Q1083]|uniref:hypothetical protein n=1 Tax=Victivallis sp. Marseille-Q1083 TaxID=2717288 RepID=UPI00158BC9A8|nr:hypothetical protein [Victivallis sp. Marseille-Q1083]
MSAFLQFFLIHFVLAIVAALELRVVYRRLRPKYNYYSSLLVLWLAGAVLAVIFFIFLCCTCGTTPESRELQNIYLNKLQTALAAESMEEIRLNLVPFQHYNFSLYHLLFSSYFAGLLLSFGLWLTLLLPDRDWRFRPCPAGHWTFWRLAFGLLLVFTGFRLLLIGPSCRTAERFQRDFPTQLSIFLQGTTLTPAELRTEFSSGLGCAVTARLAIIKLICGEESLRQAKQPRNRAFGSPAESGHHQSDDDQRDAE